MDRDELLALDKEVLVDLILRLHERVAALEAGVGRPPKGPGNSSVPPSAGYKPNRAERRRKKRGPKKGHQGLSRRRAAPDVLVRCRPTALPSLVDRCLAGEPGVLRRRHALGAGRAGAG